MAFDFTCFETFQANSSAAHSSSRRSALGLDLRLRAAKRMHVGSLRQISSADRLDHQLRGPRLSRCSKRRFFLAFQNLPGLRRE